MPEFLLPKQVRRSARPPQTARTRARSVVAGSRALVLLLFCVVLVLARGSAPSLLLPSLCALAASVATLRTTVLRRLGGFASQPITVRRRDEAVFQRLAGLCRTGDFPKRQERVADLVGFLARQAGCSAADRKRLTIASTLHRVGFVSLPPFLVEPGETARQAALLAERLLSGTTRTHRIAIEMAVSHSETWDGTGAVGGLSGPAIPFPARLLQVALALDALLPRTGYVPARREMVALAVRLSSEGGCTLDPVLANLPLLNLEELETLLQSHLRRHNSCEDRPAWWTRSAQRCVNGPFLTAA